MNIFPRFQRVAAAAAVILLTHGALFASDESVPPKPNLDMGALQQPLEPGWLQIVPRAADTSVRPDVAPNSVTVFADIKPSVINDKPAFVVDSSWNYVPPGWYTATVSVNAPWWYADSAKVPIYVSSAMPVVSFARADMTVPFESGSVQVWVKTPATFKGKIAFLTQNDKHIQVEPSDRMLDFSENNTAVITLSWNTASKFNLGSVGLILNPQGSERAFSTAQSMCVVGILPPVPPPTPVGDNKTEGFIETSVSTPVTLPRVIPVAPLSLHTVQKLTLSKGLFYRDVMIMWNSQITRISPEDEIMMKISPVNLVNSAVLAEDPTSVLYFHVPSGVTPLFTVKAKEHFVPPGKTKTVQMNISIENHAAHEDELEYNVRHRRVNVTFVNDAPRPNDVSFAFRSVSVVIDRPLNILAMNVENNPKTGGGLLLGSVSARPNLKVSEDSQYVYYTVPVWADTQLGFTDSFYYSLVNGADSAIVYVTVAPGHTRTDSEYYTARQLTGRAKDQYLYRKPSFYGEYMPLKKNKLKKTAMQNFQYDAELGLGARSRLTGRTLLIDKKRRKAYKNEFFADIADTVQVSGLGLQLYTKVKTPCERLNRLFASWTVTPPIADSYWTQTDMEGDSYLVIMGDYFSAKPRSYVEYRDTKSGKLRKMSLKVKKVLLPSWGSELRTSTRVLIVKQPKRLPEGRLDLVIDSGDGLGYIRDVDFRADGLVSVPVPEYLK